MLACIPGVAAKHEPEPEFSKYRHNEDSFWQAKLEAIVKEEGDIYTETSHVFTRDKFAESLPLPFDVITIHRKKRDVALSLWRRKSIPGRTRRGIRFLARPTFKDWERFTNYQLCYWHILESERRVQEIAELVKGNGGRTVHLEFDELIRPLGFIKLVQNLGLPQPNWEAYQKRQHWRVNANPGNYYSIWPEGDLDRLESEVLSALNGAG